ncbi:MAG: hypothetical protein ACREIC_08710, partial [Limisphaerales bacterium]
ITLLTGSTIGVALIPARRNDEQLAGNCLLGRRKIEVRLLSFGLLKQRSFARHFIDPVPLAVVMSIHVGLIIPSRQRTRLSIPVSV